MSDFTQDEMLIIDTALEAMSALIEPVGDPVELSVLLGLRVKVSGLCGPNKTATSRKPDMNELITTLFADGHLCAKHSNAIFEPDWDLTAKAVVLDFFKGGWGGSKFMNNFINKIGFIDWVGALDAALNKAMQSDAYQEIAKKHNNKLGLIADGGDAEGG